MIDVAAAATRSHARTPSSGRSSAFVHAPA